MLITAQPQGRVGLIRLVDCVALLGKQTPTGANDLTNNADADMYVHHHLDSHAHIHLALLLHTLTH